MAAAKPAVVGGFVLGALLIAIVAALVLGGMRWFSPTMHAMVVFKGSVAGLSAGSPVTFVACRSARSSSSRFACALPIAHRS